MKVLMPAGPEGATGLALSRITAPPGVFAMTGGRVARAGGVYG